MPNRVIARRELPITCEHDVVVIRKLVREVARERGFDSFAMAAITTATSELTRNAWLHGGGGTCVLEELEIAGNWGLRLIFRDEGPGIEDLDLALKGGHSTRRSLGLGLSGSKRLVDEFHIDSKRGVGTTVRVEKWARRRA